MLVLLFQTHVNDKKHGLEFDKDRISYRHKTFDAILSKDFKAQLAKEMLAKGLRYPVALVLDDDDYFLKAKKYTKSDGTEATKTRITILNAQSFAQGKFESQTLDELINIYEREMASSDAELEADAD